MSKKSVPFRLKLRVNVPPAQVYRAFTHPLALRDWLCDYVHVEPRAGGPLYLQWNRGYVVTGVFTSVTANERVAFTWHGTGEPEPTRVQVVLAENNGGTLVALTHSGIGTGKKWATAREQVAEGWKSGLENLASVLETGVDLRYVRTPRLGIWIDYLTRETVQRLQVPVKEGVLIQGTLEGTGAQASGMQKDDVMVQMGGKRITGPEAISPVVRGRKAGDKLPVVVYRGKERVRLQVELSPRPVSPVPESSAEVISQARANYDQVNKALGLMLEGVTEEEADFHPAPDAWSVKELIAHLIAAERDYQSWLADMVNDKEVGESLEYRPNVTPRLQAMVKRLNTLAALRAELEAAQNESLDFIAALPAEFVARKHMYRRAALWEIEVTKGHLADEHGDQLRSTVQTARAASTNA